MTVTTAALRATALPLIDEGKAALTALEATLSTPEQKAAEKRLHTVLSKAVKALDVLDAGGGYQARGGGDKDDDGPPQDPPANPPGSNP